jgi:hypothetical protein
MATRDELVVALIERYASGGRLERGRILDECKTACPPSGWGGSSHVCGVERGLPGRAGPSLNA